MNTATFFGTFNVTLGNATPMRDLPGLADAITAQTVNHLDRHVIVENFTHSPVATYTFTVWVRYVAANPTEASQIIKDAVAELRQAGHNVDAIHVRQWGTSANLTREGV